MVRIKLTLSPTLQTLYSMKLIHTDMNWALVPVITLTVWAVSFFISGGHEYSDGLHYAANSATLSRDLHAEPTLDWEKFVSHDQELGEPHPYVNHLYTVTLAFVQSAFDKPKLWHGSLLSLAFALLGAFSLYLLLRHLLPPAQAMLIFVLTMTSAITWSTLARPLTDTPFWGLTLFTLWYALHSRRVFSTGLLIGLTCTFRMQGVYTFLLMPLLLCDRPSIASAIRTWLRMGLGVIPFAALYVFIASATGPETSHAMPPFLYLEKWKYFYGTASPAQYIMALNTSLGDLLKLNSLTPLLIPAGASLFLPAKNRFINRLALFAFGSILLLIFTTCTAGAVPTRYYLPYQALILLAAWTMLNEQAKLFPEKLIRRISWSLFICMGILNIVPLALQLPHMSFENIGRPHQSGFDQVIQDFQPTDILATTEPRLLLLSFPGRNLVTLPNSPESFLAQAGRNHELTGLVFIFNRLQTEPELQSQPWRARASWKGQCSPTHRWTEWSAQLQKESFTDSSGNRFLKIYDVCDWLERRVVFVRANKGY
ncbi:MAG: hypothetical protein KKB70_09540 [Proteobacteria bacterium]|nr:hypothetical protein [Pseudomonadota bacterium]MBU1610730.1 hypothetical protein [Pseudomonadota bacterium]